jgi:curli biogenesis system outer membrane secretion channel CsgG
MVHFSPIRCVVDQNVHSQLNTSKQETIMKNIIRGFALVAVLLMAATPGYAQPRPAAPATRGFTGSDEELGALIAWAVPNKADNQWWYHGGAEAAQDVFVTEVVGSGKFKVVEREQMEAVIKSKLEEANLTFGQNVNTPTAVKLGKALGVKYLLTGTVTEYGATDKGITVTFIGKLIDTSTGEIVWADEVRQVSVGGVGGGVDDRRIFEKGLKPAIQQLVGKLVAAGK